MFTSIDTTEVLRTIGESPTKTCDLCPIRTSLLKSISSPLIIHISRIINRSLIQGIFPEELKKSLVLPLLKKVSLAPDKLVNYRPISNLSFISKIIERVVLIQLNKYLFDNNLYPDLQSAYRRNHSTKTALIKPIDDIGSALDDKLEVLLVLIDLSSAFDTVDHQILINRLRVKFGISGLVLAWFESYMHYETADCQHRWNSLIPKDSKMGVPQGSVLGPLLFSLYISPIEDIVRFHGMLLASYADDSQVYISIKPQERNDISKRLEACYVTSVLGIRATCSSVIPIRRNLSISLQNLNPVLKSPKSFLKVINL